MHLTRPIRAMSLLLCTMLALLSFGCQILKNAFGPQPTEAPTAAPTAVPTPEPTEVPTPEPTAEPTPEPTAEPTQKPVAYADIIGSWTLTGAMRNDSPVDIHAKQYTSYLRFFDDRNTVYYWNETAYSQRITGVTSLRGGMFAIQFPGGGQMPVRYDPVADVLLVHQSDNDTIITDYVYSRAMGITIPTVEPPVYEKTGGILGTWDLVYAEGKSRDGAATANMINTVLEQSSDYMFRYVFKETLSGYAYESGYDSETLSYLRYTVGDGTLRITDTSLSLLGTETPSYTVEGDTLRLSDGDLTLTFLRVGGNLPL